MFSKINSLANLPNSYAIHVLNKFQVLRENAHGSLTVLSKDTETLHRMSRNPALWGLVAPLEAGCPYSFSSWTLGNPADHCRHEYLHNWGPSWRQVTCLCETFALSLQRRGGLNREGPSEDKTACLPISSSFTSTSERDNFSESLTLGDHACLSLIQDAAAFLSMRIKTEEGNEWLIVSDWPFSTEPAWPKCCAPPSHGPLRKNLRRPKVQHWDLQSDAHSRLLFNCLTFRLKNYIAFSSRLTPSV